MSTFNLVVNSGPLAAPSVELQAAYDDNSPAEANQANTALKALTKDQLAAYPDNLGAQYVANGENLASRIKSGGRQLDIDSQAGKTAQVAAAINAA